MGMADSAYLIAFRAESMETRQEIISWLKERGAVHVLADTWLLKTHFPMAGDVEHELQRYQDIEGRLIVLKLNCNPTDWTFHGLAEEAVSWIRANLEP
jgi:hypothetical protein